MRAVWPFGKAFPLLTVLLVLSGIGIDASDTAAVQQPPDATQQTPPTQQTTPTHQTPPSTSPNVAAHPSAATAPGAPTPIGQAEEKRILGVLPNYRTAEMSAQAIPLTAKQKMKIAMKDSFDYPLIFIGAAYAGFYQAEDTHPQFGQGAKGYFKRFGTSYTDQLDGNMLSEGVMPVLFREDPRYFRMDKGPIKRRLWYSLSRSIVTRTDSGHSSFNFSEFLGNGIAAGVGLSYYSDDRDVGDYMENWGTQLATDAASQVLKEFWPDIKRKWHSHRVNSQ